MSRYRDEFVDAAYWHPKCKNFTIMDWAKWEAKNPAPPMVFNPPQRYASYEGPLFCPLYWWSRSCWFQPLGWALHASCCSRKPERGKLTDVNDKILKEMLGPNPDSSRVHSSMRNSLFWTEHNNAPETLISFNRWAWRSQSEEGRVLALGDIQKDFSNDQTIFGFGFTLNKRYAALQISPDERWIMMTTFADPHDVEEECKFLYLYVVQEEDSFTTPNGTKIDHVQPGDLVRLTWGDLSDPYECDNSKLKYMYFPRRVAVLNEDTGEVEMNSPHYEALLSSATNDPNKCLETCCYTCAPCMSGIDRWDFQVSNVSDSQVYAIAPTPPSGEVIERL